MYILDTDHLSILERGGTKACRLGYMRDKQVIKLNIAQLVVSIYPPLVLLG